MVSLNVANIPTPLWNALLELKGKLHARTWVEVLAYAVQDPEGTIDFELLQGGLLNCPNCGRPALHQPATNLDVQFRTGGFVYNFNGKKPKEFTLLASLPQGPKGLQALILAKNH